MIHDEVLHFIDGFKAYNKNAIETTFSEGYCYWFSFILKERFSGIIMYIPIYNHFCTKIGNVLYDIKGEITNEEYISLAEPWYIYSTYDKLEAGRIIRDCISKI